MWRAMVTLQAYARPALTRGAWFPPWPSEGRACQPISAARRRVRSSARAQSAAWHSWSGSVWSVIPVHHQCVCETVSVGGSCRGSSDSIKVRAALRRTLRFRPLLLLLRPAAAAPVRATNPRTNGATSTRRGWSARRRRPKSWTDRVSIIHSLWMSRSREGHWVRGQCWFSDVWPLWPQVTPKMRWTWRACRSRPFRWSTRAESR